jgi:hypothetical protein
MKHAPLRQRNNTQQGSSAMMGMHHRATGKQGNSAMLKQCKKEACATAPVQR